MAGDAGTGLAAGHAATVVVGVQTFDRTARFGDLSQQGSVGQNIVLVLFAVGIRVGDPFQRLLELFGHDIVELDRAVRCGNRIQMIIHVVKRQRSPFRVAYLADPVLRIARNPDIVRGVLQ